MLNVSVPSKDLVIGAIGDYSIQHGDKKPGLAKIWGSESKLFEGCDAYSKRYMQKVRVFIRDYLNHPPEAQVNESERLVWGEFAKYLVSSLEKTQAGIENPRHFFREAFKAYINLKSQNGQLPQLEPELKDIREANPEKATLTLEKLLGKVGTQLYSLGSEEEYYDEKFREAYAHASTEHYEGEKWLARPAVIVAGPSGCGKSYSSEVAIKKTAELLPKDINDHSGNDIIFIDNSKARELSQMQSMVIQLANRQDFTGVSDLYAKSKVLNKIKNHLYNAALDTDVGLVIPDTFSHWYRVDKNSTKMMEQLNERKDTKLVFCSVESKSMVGMFKRVVAFMGSRRAWKTKGFQPEPTGSIDISQPKPENIESKAYGAGGFFPGLWGSWAAKKWFTENSREQLTITVTNDLLLLQRDPNDPERYIDAKPKDKNAFLISFQDYQDWENEHRKGGLFEEVSLEDFNKPLKTSMFLKRDPNHPARYIFANAGESDAIPVTPEIEKMRVSYGVYCKFLRYQQFQTDATLEDYLQAKNESKVSTSVQFSLQIAKQKVVQLLNSKLKESNLSELDIEKIKALQTIRKQLGALLKKTTVNENGLNSLLLKVEEYINHFNEVTTFKFTSKTLTTLKQVEKLAHKAKNTLTSMANVEVEITDQTENEVRKNILEDANDISVYPESENADRVEYRF